MNSTAPTRLFNRWTITHSAAKIRLSTVDGLQFERYQNNRKNEEASLQMTDRPQAVHHPWLAQLVQLLQNPHSLETQQLLEALHVSGGDAPVVLNAANAATVGPR